MGGRSGDGAVVPTPDGISPYDAPWHRKALGLTLTAGAMGAWTIDAARHARETLPDYAALSYYEKWIAALADLVVAGGLLGPADLGQTADAPTAAPAAALHPKALRAEAVAKILAKGSPYGRAGPAPDYQPGQRVRTRTDAASAVAAGGHTRLPLYAAGKVGRVLLSHGCHVFPDSNAHGLGEAAEPLYTVTFAAADLWDTVENPADEVTLDLWQSYLVPDAG